MLCLGNQYMKDDGVGLEVARRMKGDRPHAAAVLVERRSIDLASVWRFRGAAKLVVVDALDAGDSPGTVSRHMIAPRGAPILELPGLHGFNLHDAVDFARSDTAPLQVVVVGVQPRDCGPGEGLSKEVEAAVPVMVKTVLEELARTG